MLFSLFYELLFDLSLFFSLPKVLFEMVRSGKYRRSFLKRLGFFQKVEKKGEGPLIWVHAVSVGETLSVAKLCKKLKEKEPSATLVVSNVTETGYDTGKRAMPFVDYHLFLPFDSYFSVFSLLRNLSIDLLILSETDFWYRFLKEAKKRGARTLLVSGKISEKSLKRFLTFSFFTKKLLACVDRFFVQNALYKERFLQLPIESEKVEVTGNLKLDIDLPVFSSDFKEELGFKKDDRIITIGSSHDPEEQVILEKLRPLLEKDPSIKLLFVPRHPERFEEVFSMMEKSGFGVRRYSGKSENPFQIYVGDVLGKLLHFYKIASVAIVAGSFIERVGGHNILEPIFLGIPTCCGPYMHTQAELLEIAQNHNAISQTNENDLLECVEKLLDQKSAPSSLQAELSCVLDTTLEKVVASLESPQGQKTA